MKNYAQSITVTLIAVFTLLSLPVVAQETKGTRKPKRPAKQERYDPAVSTPTLANVRYGEHERHALDFWKAEASGKTPLVFVIHRGGWVGRSKERLQCFAATPIHAGAPNHLLDLRFSFRVDVTSPVRMRPDQIVSEIAADSVQKGVGGIYGI